MHSILIPGQSKYMLHDLAAACRKTKCKELQGTIHSPIETMHTSIARGDVWCKHQISPAELRQPKDAETDNGDATTRVTAMNAKPRHKACAERRGMASFSNLSVL